MSEHEDDPHLLAAEFVLGTMEPAAARVLARRAQSDPALASAILEWQERLDPLTEVADPAPPDATLWRRLEAEIGADETSRAGGVGHVWGNARIWRGATAAALAIAAALALWIVSRPVMPVAVATLTTPGSLQPAATAAVHTDGTVTFHLVGPVTVAESEALDLWALPAGTTEPKLLGGIRLGGGRFTAPVLPSGSQLMVTLDAKSSSSKATPGRTLFAGVLIGLGSPIGP